MKLHQMKIKSLERVYISGNIFCKKLKRKKILDKTTSFWEISIGVSSEAITYTKKSDIQLGRKKSTSTCNVTQLGRFAMCN